MPMGERPENTRVNIYGREYSIRGEGDPAYIAEIAHFLDMRMRQMTENVAMTPTAKVAILASLNIIDELFSRTAQLEEMEDSHKILLASLADRIDNALSEEDEGDSAGKSTGAYNSEPRDTSFPVIFQKSSQGSSEES